MARLGLGEMWECVLANDISPKKCASYEANFGRDHLFQGDINDLDLTNLLQPIDLYWASSPCQDFSLAGKGYGLKGKRSGAFEGWLNALQFSVSKGFGPRIITFENVVGLLTRNAGQDFLFIVNSIAKLGYKVGALEIDAVNFLPQSRPRLFVIAVRDDVDIDCLTLSKGQEVGSKRINAFLNKQNGKITSSWVNWNIKCPPVTRSDLSDLIEINDTVSKTNTDQLLMLMSDAHRKLTLDLINNSKHTVGTLYKRGRPDKDGTIRQRAEVRFDGIAGCLRTPGGGSSKQTVLIAGHGHLTARLLTPRECARLMGLPESYILPEKVSDGYHLTGDGVAVPVVAYLNKELLAPLLSAEYAQVAA